MSTTNGKECVPKHIIYAGHMFNRHMTVLKLLPNNLRVRVFTEGQKN